MERKRLRSAKARPLLVVAIVAIGALFTIPAHALAPGEVEFAGLGADGFIDNADNSVFTDSPPSVPVHWQAPAGGLSSVVRFTNDAGVTGASNCGPFNLGATSSDASAYLNSACYLSFPQGNIHLKVKWFDGTSYTAESDDVVVKNLLAPGAVEFAGLGADGIINAADNAVFTDSPPSVPVHWSAPSGAISAEVRFTNDAGVTGSGTCGPFISPVTSLDGSAFLGTNCYLSFPEGNIHLKVKWFDGTSWSPEADDVLLKDVITIPAPTITKPENGALYNATGSPAKGGLTFATGIADSGDTVTLYQDLTPDDLLLGSTTATGTGTGTGTWSIPINGTPTGKPTPSPKNAPVFGSGTHSVYAVASDNAGNVSSVTPPVTFDLDSDRPTAQILAPANQTIFGPNDVITVEGFANDPNLQNAFEGITTVQVNIFSVLAINPRPAPLPYGSPLGDYILQDGHAVCTGCAPPTNRTGAGREVDWTFIANDLPPGSYTFQIYPVDKAGNFATQPATTNIIVLPG